MRRWLLVIVAALVGIAWYLARRDDPSRRIAWLDRDEPVAGSAAVEPARTTATPRLLPAGELRLEGIALGDDDQPIAGATVTLDGARSATTEVDGTFAFDALAPGSYSLIAEKGVAYGEEHDVVLDEHSDPVMLKLASGPTLALHVVTPDGAPIAGARIETSSRSAVTDGSGAARLRGVDTGYEIVNASADGREKLTARIVTGDDPAGMVEHTLVLGASFAVGGRVVDEDGKPVAEASVELESIAGKRDETVSCDEHGAWHIADLGAGRYVARARSDHHVDSTDLVVDLAGPRELELKVDTGAQVAGRVVDEHERPASDARVYVGSKSETTDAAGRFAVRGLAPDTYDLFASTDRAATSSRKLTIARHARVEVELALRPSWISGVVVDPHGQPIEDARVMARNDDAFGISTTHTDAHGRFELGGMPPGDYDVEARRADRAHDNDRAVLRVASGARDVHIVLTELATIHGRVVLDGQPVRFFGVALSNDPSTIAWERPRAVSDDGGAFTEKGIDAGTWSVVIVGPGFARRVLPAIRVEPGASIDLGTIAVDRGGSIRGRVSDGRGAPIAGAVVHISSGSSDRPEHPLRGLMRGSYTARTDARGEYRIDGVEPIEHRIVAMHPTLGSSPWRVLQPEDRNVDLAIAGTGGIDGVLPVDVANTSVTATLASDGESRFEVDVDASGAFHFDVPAGEYEVATFGHLAPPPVRVVVTAGQRVRVAFTAGRPSP
jgi:protocatechuate 3,4-dioxygenase beta subunit